MDENAFELFRRVQAKPFRTTIPFLDRGKSGDGLLPKSCIELYGGMGTAKSSILMFLSSKFVLPEEYGGHNGKVLYFDHGRSHDLLIYAMSFFHNSW